VFLYSMFVRFGFWNPDKDEHASEALLEEEALAAERENDSNASDDAEDQPGRRLPPLFVALLPVLVPLVMIAFGAIADAAGFSTSLIAFIGNPVFALFVGLVGAYILAKATVSRELTDEAMSKGFDTMGQILLITGVGGSLGEVSPQRT
jgi:GntP family gluconate:H+ symporter